jgi:hypothetical protein
VVSELLGHASILVTLETYSHLIKGQSTLGSLTTVAEVTTYLRLHRTRCVGKTPHQPYDSTPAQAQTP